MQSVSKGQDRDPRDLHEIRIQEGIHPHPGLGKGTAKLPRTKRRAWMVAAIAMLFAAGEGVIDKTQSEQPSCVILGPVEKLTTPRRKTLVRLGALVGTSAPIVDRQDQNTGQDSTIRDK